MSVLNRKMFNRGARKELRKKGGIADVQYFQNAGRVDVSNISNQDAINMALNASPQLREKLKLQNQILNSFVRPLVPGMYVNKEGGIFQPNSSVTKITNEQINQLLRNRAERAKSPIGFGQGYDALFKPEEATTVAGLAGSKVGQLLGEGVDYGVEGIKSVAKLFQKKNLNVPGLRKLIEEGDPKGILDGIDLTQLEGIEKIDPSLARPPGMVPGKITQVGDENQITKPIPELRTMYDTDNVPEIDASINAEIKKLLYPDEKEVQEQKKKEEEKNKVITGTGKKNELDRGARDPVDTSKEETSKEETSDVEPPVSRPPELVKEVFKAGNEEQKKNVIDDIIKQFTDRAPKYEGLNQGLAIAKIGFAMAAGESPNAMTNIAKALSDGADMLIKDKDKKDAFNRQIQLTALQLGMTEAAQERQLERSLEFQTADYVLMPGEKYTYPDGRTITGGKEGTTISLNKSDILKNGLPDGVQGTAIASALLSKKAAYEAALAKLKTDAIKGKTLKSPKEITDHVDNYSKSVDDVIQSNNMLHLTRQVMVKNAKGEITGFRPGFNSLVGKAMAAAGVDATAYTSRDEAIADLRKVFQKLVPLTLGKDQSANSISDKDVNRLADAFMSQGILDGGILSLMTTPANVLNSKLSGILVEFENAQDAAIARLNSLEQTGNEFLTPSGALLGTRVSEQRKRLQPFLPGGVASSQATFSVGEDGIFRLT
jgi:hypothetical protein